MKNEKVDRDTVEKFFKWEDPRARLYTIGGICALIGIPALYAANFIFGLVALGIGALLIWRGANSTQSFMKYYEAVKMAKAYDFDAILRRSYEKSETAIGNLLDFDAQDLMPVDPDLPRPPREDLLTALARKSVFLYGPSDDEKRGPCYMRWIRIGSRIHTEYSPIRISVLYLTRKELIVYFADVDITRGDLRLEEMMRVALDNIVEIRTRSEEKRRKRQDEPTFFKSYEKQTRTRLADEYVRRDHTIRVTKTDGIPINLPVGAPEYTSGKAGTLDRDGGDDERFTRVAREISKRITDAKGVKVT